MKTFKLITKILSGEFTRLAEKDQVLLEQIAKLERLHELAISEHENYRANTKDLEEMIENHCNCCNKVKECSETEEDDGPYSCAFFKYCPKRHS